LRKMFDVTKTGVGPVHPAIDDESVRRVVVETISLYQRDLRTLTRCSKSISLLSSHWHEQE
jgi:hypothetical protein